MSKRIAAAAFVSAVWVLLVWFTAWDRSPSQWTPDLRFIVALIGLGLAAGVATCPIFDED